jgi:hypothetical protein
MLHVPKAVLGESFEILRACGSGNAECVVYWLGPRDRPELVDEVVHPLHNAHAGGYDVDGAWQTELWLTLASEARELRTQLHTHPGAAYHSSRDDRMAALQIEGFLSLVIPNFALGPAGLDDTYLARRNNDGGWDSLPPEANILIEG